MNPQTADEDRRRFLLACLASGGGLAIGLGRSASAYGVSDTASGPRRADALREFSPWLLIARDGTVTVRVTLTECGNGAMTQMAMTVAEELPCDWAKVRVEPASAQRDAVEAGLYTRVVPELAWFSGRSTTREWIATMLQVGASARERLRLAAAQRWRVALDEIEARDGRLLHARSGRALGYGDVAEQAAGIALAQEPRPKSAKKWTLLGRATPAKLHTPALVDGSAMFGIDVRLPDMLYAALMQSPVQGGRLRRCDAGVARRMPGVRAVVFVDPDEPRPLKVQKPYTDGFDDPQAAVAVIADHYWQARKALDALRLEWDDGAGARWKSTAQIVDEATRLLGVPGRVASEIGTPDALIQKSARIVEADYLTPYCEHATLEPLNGTALVTADRVDVWHPSQYSTMGQHVAAEEAGLPPDKVHFHPTLIGGGFGRRVFGNDVRMVVAVARKHPGRPIHVIWSREETMRQGRYRPLNAVRLKASLAADGRIEALVARSVGRGMQPRGVPEAARPGYSTAFGIFAGAYGSGLIPHARVEWQDLPLHLMAGPYRGPGYNSNAFVLECFTDECAAAAGLDPLEFRLKLYESWPDPGPMRCLREAATRAGWSEPLPVGQARGIAIGNWGGYGQPKAGTTVCCVATVEVSRAGELRVQALDLAFDCGSVLNAAAVRAQLEGALVFGLNMSLNEELNVENGRIVEGNFHEYPLLRIHEIPALRVHFGALTGHERHAEIGEAGVGVVGPAIANAISRIIGRRIRSTPLRRQDLRWGA